VGLGNPGERYSGSRHNMGFRVVEALSRHWRSGRPDYLRWSMCAAAEYGGRKVLLVQPLTFMNRSGLAVEELFSRFSAEPENLIVIHDEMDLPPGVLRLKKGGGAAGHRGVQSIIDTLGTADFIRLRMGIGKAPPGEEGADYVLGRFAPEEEELMEAAVNRAVQALATLLEEGLESAMNKFN